MTILTKEKPEKIELDLRGPQGNAWFLISLVREFALITNEDPQPIIDQMMEGDYDNLVKTFDEHFGSFVNLYK